jgi:hypothetical protein
MTKFLRTSSAVALAILLGTMATLPSEAARGGRNAYDGLWNVSIRTQYGSCGALSYSLRIAGGRAMPVDQSYQAYGVVSPGGAIRVTVSGGGQSASGSGHLSSRSGGGRWRIASGECAGTWAAGRVSFH